MAYSLNNQTPTLGYISWASVHIVYNGTDNAVADGASSKSYVYWLASAPTVLQASNTYPALGPDDALVFINRSGVGVSVLDAAVVDGSMIVPGTVMAQAIAAGAVQASHIAAGAIQAEHVSAYSINTDHLTVDAIVAHHIQAGAIESEKIVAGAITTDLLAADAVIASKIAAGAIAARHIAANAITANIINAGLATAVDIESATFYGSSLYIGGTPTYEFNDPLAPTKRTGIASVANPLVALTAAGATFDVDHFAITGGPSPITPFEVVGGVTRIKTAAIGDATIGSSKIDRYLASSDWDGTVATDGTVSTAGTRGWVLARGNGAAGSSKMEVDAANIRGTLNVSQLNISDEKSVANQGRTNVYIGTAPSSGTPAAHNIKVCEFTSTGHATMVSANGALWLYVNGKGGIICDMSVRFRVFGGPNSQEFYTDPVESIQLLAGGYWDAPSSSWVYSIPFSLQWLFSGSYWKYYSALKPGRGGFTPVPSNIENFLVSGTWSVYVNLSFALYGPETDILGYWTNYAQVSASGFAFSIPGSTRYDPPNPVIM